MIIFGTRERKLGRAELPGHSCGYCDSRGTLFAQACTMYFHIFWIPVFPYAKRVYSVCSHCRQSLTRYQMPPDLNATAMVVGRELKAPWYYYTGLILLAVVLLLLAVTMIIGAITSVS